jgi:Tfp pilus assembly protein PilV
MKGQTLIEVLAALGIVIIIITALTGVVITSMSNTRFSKDQSLATQYAQEGMEIVRQKRDNNYADFRGLTGTYCLGTSTALDPDCSDANITENGNSFLRKVTITQDGCGANVARVMVLASWQDSKCPAGNTFCHASRLESCLSTVNPVTSL